MVMAVGEPLLVVESLARPGGNITGLSGVQPELETKRMKLLKEMAPTTSENSRIGTIAATLPKA